MAAPRLRLSSVSAQILMHHEGFSCLHPSFAAFAQFSGPLLSEPMTGTRPHRSSLIFPKHSESRLLPLD